MTRLPSALSSLVDSQKHSNTHTCKKAELIKPTTMSASGRPKAARFDRFRRSTFKTCQAEKGIAEERAGASVVQRQKKGADEVQYQQQQNQA